MGRTLLVVAVALVAGGLAAPAARAEPGGSTELARQSGLVAAGYAHTCAVLLPGAVRCWGDNEYGRLGHAGDDVGDDEPPGALPPVALPGEARAVATGERHSCALLADGVPWCWGDNGSGQLGTGSEQFQVPTPAPVALPPGRTARAVTAGVRHTCLLLDDGSVRCFGGGSEGQTGQGSTDEVRTAADAEPVDLGAGHTARAVVAGGFHTCAIRDDGSVLCWGWNTVGALGVPGAPEKVGDDEPASRYGPVDLGGREARGLALERVATCALLDGGAVRCWGSWYERAAGGGAGRLLDLDGDAATGIGAGDDHACATVAGGGVRCWGESPSFGQTVPELVGDDEPARPLEVPPGLPARAVAGGDGHTCVLLADGGLRCLGRSEPGGLGRPGEEFADRLGSPLDLDGVLAASTADLSVAVSAAAPTVPEGDEARVTVVLRNDGPDAAFGLVVGTSASPGWAGGALAATHGGFDAGTGTWFVGALGPGEEAALVLALRAGAPGPHALAAELLAAAAEDPDSRAGGGAPGEDDAAALTVVAEPRPAAPAPPAPGPPLGGAGQGPGGPAGQGPGPGSPGTRRVRPPRLTLSAALRPARGGVVRLVARGRLVLPRGVARAAGCRGRVEVQARAGRRVLARGRATLVPRGRRCTYAVALRVGTRAARRTGRVAVRARFAGNARLLPRSAPTVTRRIG